MSDLPKQYQAQDAQAKWLDFWKDNGYFDANPNPDKKPHTIMIPLPNVTGALHMGHALNGTLQDLITRWRRMQGYEALWMPGTDHAGIATQAVVERRMFEEEGLTRHDLGPTVEACRDALQKRIWKWKDAYEKRILEQLRQLGASCDWRRTRFTLDDVCSKAVRRTFFKFFKDGLIFRGKRLVNWDPHLQTAVANDEVFHEEVDGHFWTFTYPVVEEGGETRAEGRGTTGEGQDHVPSPPEEGEGGRRPDEGGAEAGNEIAADASSGSPSPALRAPSPQGGEGTDSRSSQPSTLGWVETGEKVAFSTTRPETMLGDSAVCVHPTDERYEHLVGKHVLIPLTGRAIPIIADGLLAKKDLGTGCVKVTPAHDHNDYACGLRNDLEQINILNPDATINENGAQYEGMDRYDCRTKVVEDMKELGHFVEVEDRKIELAHSDRSKSPVEPYLSDQWFVKMDELAQGAIDAVTDRRVRFYPQRYQSTYLDWLGEKRDWCISRQLWWGHRIPVWTIEISVGGPAGELREKRFAELQKKAQTLLTEIMTAAGVDGHKYHLQTPTDCVLRCCPDSDRAMDVLVALEQFQEANRARRGQPDESAEEHFELRGASAATESARELVIRSPLKISQEEDVLDTWFSSALWPHATLGWPDETQNPPLAEKANESGKDGESSSRSQALPGNALPRSSASGDDGKQSFQTVSSQAEPGTELESANLSPLTPRPSAENEVLPYFYPGNVLITSRDIITLWVARMVLTGLYNMGDIPFGHVHVHPKILDGFGQTMSKSKGNGCDPQDLIDRYGTDAVRFTISSFAGETQDVKLPMGYECPHCQNVIPQALDDGGPMVKPATVKQSLRGSKDRILMPCPKCKNESQFSTPQYDLDPDQPAARMVSDRFEYGRNFCNKLWNAARFAIMNLEGYTPGEIAESDLHLEDHWILSRLSRVAGEVTTLLDRYQFDQATRAIRDFTWNEFCDWYLEMIKPRLRAGKEAEGRGLRDEGQETAPSPPEGGEGGRRPDEGGAPNEIAADASSDSPSPALRAPSPPQGGEGTEQGEIRASAQRVLVGVLDNLVRLLQPFTPFICEELWQKLNDIAPERGLFKPEASAESVMIAPWPELEESLQNEPLEARFARLQETVVAVRNIRAVYNISPAEPIELHMKCESDIASELEACSGQFENLARTVLSAAGAEVSRPSASASFSLKDADGFVPLGGLIDVAEELERQQKEAQKIRGFIKGHSAKLANEKFVSKAPPHVVAEVRETLANLEKQLESVEAIISQLSGG